MFRDIVATMADVPVWVWVSVIVVVTFVLAFAVRRLILRLFGQVGDPAGFGHTVARFAWLLVVVFGALYALSVAGFQVGALLGAVGVGSLALAFAAQEILGNILAGIVLQLRRPFRVGDHVTTLGYEGIVRDVELRSVRLETFDGLDVILPNSEVLKSPITNHSLTPGRRASLRVRVAYDTDLERARNVLLAAIEAVPGVDAEPAPAVWVNEFGDSAITLEILVWHGSEVSDRWEVRSEVAIAAKAALDQAGITIPFPQRVVHTA